MLLTPLSLYNTHSRSAQQVKSADGEAVNIYCCGPTVHREAHVGNMRTFLLADLVVRTLKYSGVKVRVIQNITDVGHLSDDFQEDKVLAQSKKESKDPFEIARIYEERFHIDLARMQITPADKYPRASEYIDQMQTMITRLIAAENAYIGEDKSVYFSAESFAQYGEISGNKLSALKPGHRYTYSDDGVKRFHADWALWKSADERTEMVWESPWGLGFPGWHIECSAMSLDLLDSVIDLHIGGIDLRFPHHENERAQSNSIIGNEAVALWLHGEHLLFEGRKMSKSAGNVVLVADILAKNLDPLSLRFCFLENRYRSQMDLSWAGINSAAETLNKWRMNYHQWTTQAPTQTPNTEREIESIVNAFNNDLDTPRAMQGIRNIQKTQALNISEKRYIVEKVDQLFGLDLTRAAAVKEGTPEILRLLALRLESRKVKDFLKSDEIRKDLANLGIEVRDKGEVQEWSWKTI